MRLLAHQKDIVGGSYVRRTPPYDLLSKTLSGKAGGGLERPDGIGGYAARLHAHTP